MPKLSSRLRRLRSARVRVRMPRQRPEWMSVEDWMLSTSLDLLLYVRRLARFIAFCAFVSLALLAALNLQVERRDRAISRAEAASKEAEVAARQASNDLADALEQSSARQGVDPGAVARALEAIHRIERQLCGAEPCPVDERGNG